MGTTLANLTARWRTDADLLEAHGAVEAAATKRRDATELDAAVREAEAEELTLEQARRESGYSERRLRELLADGAIPNAGRRHAPRIRRADLPRKPRAAGGAFDARAEAAVIRGGGR